MPLNTYIWQVGLIEFAEVQLSKHYKLPSEWNSKVLGDSTNQKLLFDVSYFY